MNDFDLIGIQPLPKLDGTKRQSWFKGKPLVSMAILAVIILCSLFAELVMTHDPTYMELTARDMAPCSEYLFGTDPLGRDIFSMIWYGGRISIFIGLASTALSTVIAFIYGCISGLVSRRWDTFMMRALEIFMSVPSMMVIILIQAIMGKASALSLSIVIGITGWMNIAKLIRSEVRQISGAEYILAAKSAEAGFFYTLRRHLMPNFISSIMFMLVTNIGTAIGTEATLSFLGVGLPIEVVSWGSMLSQADRAFLSNSWWLIIIPGLFLVVTLVCIADVGNYIRKLNNKGMNQI